MYDVVVYHEVNQCVRVQQFKNSSGNTTVLSSDCSKIVVKSDNFTLSNLCDSDTIYR